VSWKTDSGEMPAVQRKWIFGEEEERSKLRVETEVLPTAWGRKQKVFSNHLDEHAQSKTKAMSFRRNSHGIDASEGDSKKCERDLGKSVQSHLDPLAAARREYSQSKEQKMVLEVL
jgi:hypothetical protein